MPLQATSGAASYDAFGGGVPVEPVYIEQIFSTYLYTGTSATQTITNGIDLAGEGGLVWLKARGLNGGYPQDHSLIDTVRGPTVALASNLTSGNLTQEYALGTSGTFNSDGFTIASTNAQVNDSAVTVGYVSWTFRKQPKFFDIVTYTGNGVLSYEVPHNLQSVPGCIIWKRTDSTSAWGVWHIASGITTSKTGGSLNATNAFLYTLNATPYQSATTFQPAWVSDAAGNNGNINGATYVAYLFAHDAGGFGLSGTDNVISCGSYTGTGANGNNVTLGYEPQWVMTKRTNGQGNWNMEDVMRGLPASGNSQELLANSSFQEQAVSSINITSTGFQLQGAGGDYNGSGNTYIYIAIRRGPMKVPTTGTSVFGDISASVEPVSTNLTTESGVLADLVVHGLRISGTSFGRHWLSRLTGNGAYLVSSSTAAEVTQGDFWKFDNNNFAYIPPNGYANNSGTNTKYVAYSFNRAPSFFDEVCYTGTGVARTVTHNLAAVPELMIVKSRSRSPSVWAVYSAGTGNTKYLQLQATTAAVVDGIWNNTTPTSTVFSIDNGPSVNDSGSTYVAYLFATCAGVSKVGSYAGTGATQTIDCGFGAGGARFVLVKRTDSTGDWYVWDTARGMVAGTDPSLLLNTTGAEVNANSIYTIATGFQIVSTAAGINASGGTYIFLAIA